MLDAIVTHSAYLDLSIKDGVFHRSPTFESCSLTAIRRMKEEEVNVAQPTFLDASLDTATGSVVVGVACELGSIVNVFPRDFGSVRRGCKKLLYSLSGFAFVMIHLGRIHSAVTTGS